MEDGPDPSLIAGWARNASIVGHLFVLVVGVVLTELPMNAALPQCRTNLNVGGSCDCNGPLVQQCFILS